MYEFSKGLYVDKSNPKHFVEVTEEGCIFCCATNGVGLLCEYPYIGEFCDFCPLKGYEKMLDGHEN